jgi:hypothetical protein
LVLPRSVALLSGYSRRLLLVSLAATVPLVSLGLRFFWHYFLLFYPLLAIAAAPAASLLLRRAARSWARLFFAWPLAGAVVFLVLNVKGWYVSGQAEETRPIVGTIARRLASDRCAHDASLFVWGTAPILYVASRMRPASRFVVPQGTIAGYLAGNRAVQTGRVSARGLVKEQHREQLMADLERQRVTYVVDLSAGVWDGWENFPMRDFPRLQAYVDRELEPLDTVEGLDRVEGVRIYRRRGCEAELR